MAQQDNWRQRYLSRGFDRLVSAGKWYKENEEGLKSLKPVIETILKTFAIIGIPDMAKRFIAWIQARLGFRLHDSSFALWGPDRTGKTTILFRLQGRRDEGEKSYGVIAQRTPFQKGIRIGGQKVNAVVVDAGGQHYRSSGSPKFQAIVETMKRYPPEMIIFVASPALPTPEEWLGEGSSPSARLYLKWHRISAEQLVKVCREIPEIRDKCKVILFVANKVDRWGRGPWILDQGWGRRIRHLFSKEKKDKNLEERFNEFFSIFDPYFQEIDKPVVPVYCNAKEYPLDPYLANGLARALDFLGE